MRTLLGALLVATMTLAACGSGEERAVERGPVHVLTHRDFGLTEELVSQLEQSLGAPIAVVVENDQASMVDLLTASSAPPAVDVVLGLDSLDVGTVLEAGLFAPYSPRSVEHLVSTLRLGDDAVVPMRFTDVCFNFDKFWFEPPEPDFVGPAGPGRVDPLDGELDEGSTTTGDGGEGTSETSVPDEAAEEGSADGDGAPEEEGETGDVNGVVPDPPASVDVLIQAPYQGLAAMADPATDRFSLAFVAGLASTLGVPSPTTTAPTTVPATGTAAGSAAVADPALVEALAALRANGLVVTDGFQEAYFGEFTAGSVDGTRPLVLATALMPAVSVRFVDPLPEGVQTAVINDDCARLVDYAGVLAVAPNPELARRLMDLLVAPEFQFEMFDTRGSQPARTDLISRPEVAEFGIAVQPVLLDPLTTAARVDGLLAAWEQAGVAAAEQPTGEVPPDTGEVADDG